MTDTVRAQTVAAMIAMIAVAMMERSDETGKMHSFLKKESCWSYHSFERAGKTGVPTKGRTDFIAGNLFT